MSEPPPISPSPGRLVLLGSLVVTFHRAAQVGDSERAPPSVGLAPLVRLDPAGGEPLLVATRADEAVWLSLAALDPGRPVALRVGVEIPEPLDAVTGGPWSDELSASPQNYVVTPPQGAIDGVATSEARVLQIARAPCMPRVVRCDALRLVAIPGDDATAAPARAPDRPHPTSSSSARGVPQVIHPDPHGIGRWHAVQAVRVRIRLGSLEEAERLGGAGVAGVPAAYGGWRLP